MRVGSAAARLGRAPAAFGRRGLVRVRTRGWEPASRLFVLGDRARWVMDDEAAELVATAARLGYAVGPPAWARDARGQSLFMPSHFGALQPRWLRSTHRLGMAYFHGRPGTPDHPEFDAALAALRENAARVDRVQVTHAEMHELVVAAGVDAERVFRIPIGIDIERFPLGDADARLHARRSLGLPEAAFVVGSFHKDGTGWADGNQPKLIKGPDVLVGVLARVRDAVPDLFVLLTGPARGFVRRELERLGIRHRHVELARRDELASAYHALDVYLVASRQEGGPKGVLESLATGVPLVSTRVGQAQEIVEDGRTGFLADVEDADALADVIVRLWDDGGAGEALRERGRATAEAHSYPRLDTLWAGLLEGFVAREP